MKWQWQWGRPGFCCTSTQACMQCMSTVWEPFYKCMYGTWNIHSYNAIKLILWIWTKMTCHKGIKILFWTQYCYLNTFYWYYPSSALAQLAQFIIHLLFMTLNWKRRKTLRFSDSFSPTSYFFPISIKHAKLLFTMCALPFDTRSHFYNRVSLVYIYSHIYVYAVFRLVSFSKHTCNRFRWV